MITIYVIYHYQLEDTNVFFTDKTKAEQKIIELAQETYTEISEWDIRVFQEGKKFCADMSSF